MRRTVAVNDRGRDVDSGTHQDIEDSESLDSRATGASDGFPLALFCDAA